MHYAHAIHFQNKACLELCSNSGRERQFMLTRNLYVLVHTGALNTRNHTVESTSSLEKCTYRVVKFQVLFMFQLQHGRTRPSESTFS